MNESEIFRANLLRHMADRGMSEAELSKKAKLNPRAVTDIREGRVASPKMSTVFRLAEALGIDPAELMGLGRRHHLHAALAEFLEQYPEEDQARFLAALSALPRQPA
jgi:transcriptional regulator with XRE-family HTH domain